MTINQDSPDSKGTILVVTRNPEFQLCAYNILRSRGYTINSTESIGRGLKEIVNSIIPKLVIIDMTPLTTGIKIAVRMHRWAAARTLLLDFLRGDQFGVRKLDLEAPGCMSSPITVDEFAGWVEDLVEKYPGENSE